MANFRDILAMLVQQGMAPSAPRRMGNAFGMNDKSGAGSLIDIIGQLGGMLAGQAGSGSSSQSSGGLGGVLGEVIESLGGGNQNVIGNLAALAESMFGNKGTRQADRTAVGSGILSVLASLAITALRKAGHQPAAMPMSLYEPKSDKDLAAIENEAEIIVKAMINAAKADGRIDDAEVKKIIGKLQEDGLSEQEKQFFIQEANKPLDINELINSVSGRPELAAQVYAASLLAIEVDTPAEKEYLQQLAKGLCLDSQVIEHIHQLLGVH